MVTALILTLTLALTPGVVRPLTTAQVCTIKWGRDHRHVTTAMKRIVAARYGLTRAQIHPRGHGHRCCEIDHLIPRELAGADAVDNLWPQPWAQAIVKDREENRLHRAVCAGTITLTAAQEQMQQWKP